MPKTLLRSFLLLFLPFAILFSIRVLTAIQSQSLTSDEPTDITNGFYYWTQGDVVTPHNHPPLGSALQALPLLGMDLRTKPVVGDVIDRGHAFLFEWNLDRLDAIVTRTRAVSLLLGLLVGWILWKVTRDRPAVCAGALFFLVLDPTFSALSGLAKTDIAPTLFFFLAVLSFHRSQRDPSAASALAAGAASALAVNAKFYCLTLLPIFVVLDALFLREKENLLFMTQRQQEAKARWVFGLGAFFSATFLIFFPATLRDPAHHQPFFYFFSKFREDLLFAQNHMPVFFWGNAGLESHWYYLPITFFLKEPLAFLVFFFFSIGLALRGKIHLEPWVWVPPLFFITALLPSLNLGVRYLLPAFPFLCLMGGEALAWVWSRPFGRLSLSFSRTLVVVLGLWQAESVMGFPGTSIGYFNETVPVEKRIHFLGDSNLDWGQDLKRVAHLAPKKGWGKVHLAYLGAVDPKVYGLDWVPWDEEDLKSPQPGRVYLVNASFLQIGPLAYPSVKPIAQSWLADRTTDGRIGDAWYYFEVPGKEFLDPKAKLLVSVPFLEYRGYTPFYSIPR